VEQPPATSGVGPGAAARALADAIPHIVWASDAVGAFEWFNARWYAYTGLSQEETIARFGTDWSGVVHPEDIDMVLDGWRESIRNGKPYELETRLRGADGIYRWFLARSAPVYDVGSHVTGWLGTCTDIDDRKRAEAQSRYLAAAGDALGTSLDVRQTLVELAQLAVPAIGDWCSVQLLNRDGTLETIAHASSGDDATAPEIFARPIREDVAPDVARTGKSVLVAHPPAPARSLLAVPLVGRTRIYGVLQLATGPSGRQLDARDQRTAESLAARAATAIENARLYEQVQFTARAGEALAESLNIKTTMQRVLELVVPDMADWAVIDLFDEQGRVRIDAMVHVDPAMAPVVDQLVGKSTAKPEFAEIIATALRAPHTQVSVRVEPAVIAAMVQPEYREAMLALDAHSSIIVPLRSGGRPLGALVAYWSKTPRTYGDEDVPIFEEIARRAAMAIENAQLYESERHVANAFQRAALPSSLPVVAGIRFDAVYVAARNEAQVGGDWYDAVRLPDGRVVVSIGDVSGSGLEAAVTMAAMRQILRGVAHVYADPATMIDAADRTLKAEHPGRIVTALAAVFDPIGGTLTYANAGHPRPLVRAADGTITELPSDGLPLGLRDRGDVDTRVVALDRDALFVFFTDGLTESTRDPIEGERRLTAALADPAILARDDAAVALYTKLLSDGAHDDVVVLTMQVEPEAGHVHRWAFDTGDATMAREVRDALLAVLARSGLNGSSSFTAEIVFSELLGNAVRYAPGTVEVALEQDGEYAPVLHFFDRGPGFDVVPRLPMDRLSERGRGLYLVWSLADDFSVTSRPGGGSHARAVLPRTPHHVPRPRVPSTGREEQRA
jgi:PAS domain S-box-containing protein